MRIYYSRYENEMVMTALQNVQEYQGIFYRSSSEEMNRLQRKLFDQEHYSKASVVLAESAVPNF